MLFAVIIILVILFIPASRWILAYMLACESQTGTFACPNCGNSFTEKWYQMLFGRAETSTTMGWARLNCPFCKVTDTCKRVDGCE